MHPECWCYHVTVLAQDGYAVKIEDPSCWPNAVHAAQYGGYHPNCTLGSRSEIQAGG